MQSPSSNSVDYTESFDENLVSMRFGILELRNRVTKPSTQKDVTLRVTNSKIFIEILLSSY